MGLRWATNYCKNAKFVLKMDDDIALDIFQFALKVQADYSSEGQLKDSLLGYKQIGLTPQRNPKNKWFVSQNEFKGDIYPDFMSGWAYVSTIKWSLKRNN